MAYSYYFILNLIMSSESDTEYKNMRIMSVYSDLTDFHHMCHSR